MDAITGFRQRLRQVLHRRGMSQTELARQLDVRVATVNEWLNRGTMPSGPVMLRLPGILEVDGHWLLTGEHRPSGEGAALSGSERGRLTALLEDALRVLRGEPEEPASGDYLRVRGASEDEKRALDAVNSYRQEQEPPRKRQRRNHS